MRFRTLLLAGACVVGAGLGPALAADTKYQPWQGGSADVGALLESLEKLIDQAERDRAADPQFLLDLREVLAGYQAPAMKRLLSDDFKDGNYTQNPTWTVSAGQFAIDKKGSYTGLRSTIIPPGTVSGQTQSQSGAAVALNILNVLLNQPGQTQTQTQSNTQYAAIYTPVKVSNAFAVRLEFASAETFGQFHFGPYQGSGNVAYKVAYLPGQQNNIRLLRVTSKGTTTIGNSKNAVNLEDGQRHVIEWTRDGNGKMAVMLDGTAVINVADKSIANPFVGFYMINYGGSYWVRSITVDGTS